MFSVLNGDYWQSHLETSKVIFRQNKIGELISIESEAIFLYHTICLYKSSLAKYPYHVNISLGWLGQESDEGFTFLDNEILHYFFCLDRFLYPMKTYV